MKLNFWQWLGVLMLAIGIGWYIYKYINPTPNDPTNNNQQQQQPPNGPELPTTLPSTQPTD